jgi:hypothetical protein
LEVSSFNLVLVETVLQLKKDKYSKTLAEDPLPLKDCKECANWLPTGLGCGPQEVEAGPRHPAQSLVTQTSSCKKTPKVIENKLNPDC